MMTSFERFALYVVSYGAGFLLGYLWAKRSRS